jgi:tryptophan-rich sensory protein
MGSGRWWVVITSLSTIAIYAIGSGAWVGSGDGWYRSLKTPPWQPPDATFGIAWTYNFVMLAVVAIQVARHGTGLQMGLWTGSLVVSVVFALGWAWLFYSQHSLWMASASLIIAAACTVPLVIAAWSSATWAGVVLLPYLGWLCIASSLAVGYATRNA